MKWASEIAGRNLRRFKLRSILASLTALLSFGAIALGLEIGQSGMRARQPSHTLPLTKFYDTADPLPPGNAGQLIRSADFDQYNLPLQISAVRFIYYSRSASGIPVASSGVILFPYKAAPKSGWPVIAWAHNLTGVSRQCAPSLDRDLQHGPLLSMYVNLGYAVVATDYTGLGTGFRNAYADTVSNAWNVIDSVQAARSAVHQLGSHWIAVGTGAGAAAVIKVAELEAGLNDENFLGSVAISPSADLEDTFASAAGPPPGEPLFLAYGVKTTYPQFEAGQILTDDTMATFSQVTQSCAPETSKAPASAMLKPNWIGNEYVQKFFDRVRLGLTPARQPILVISTDINPALQQTSKIVDRMCREKDHLQFEKFSGFDSSVIGDSVRDQMNWIEARFANREVPNDCSGKR